MKRGWLLCALVALAGGAAYLLYLADQVRRQSQVDDARPADVIVVLGAAEYRGKPSPVLEARLSHALALYRERYAPFVLTTGGAGGDPRFTESEVGRNFLLSRGVPPEAIVMEDEGDSTIHSAVAVAEIMDRMRLKSCIIVSDSYHLYRVKRILEERGIAVYTSPRPERERTASEEWRHYFRQAAGHLLWQIGIAI
ncbi:MAG: YdcF family protein [Bryobacterales bacterium]|nr:YdcF family protein [Bryobacterales bacterium]